MNSNNKRIAKNTLLLYIRMLLIMAVTLYTSRVVLNTLGVEDYGIYNVIGGVVTMLSFFNNSMATAVQRFLNYEMGKGNLGNIVKIFSVSFLSYCFIAIIVLLLAETVGLWFVLNKLVIPADRLDAALWVYQFTIVTFIVNLLSVPYNATIIAHEKMSVFAYISILEVFGKLLIAYLITISPIDKLIFYGLLMTVISFGIRFVYSYYCKKHFAECHVKWIWDRNILKQLFGFSGWMLAGTSAHLFNTQGINLLINLFFGPILNTARAISVQVYNAVNSFSLNFMMATRPQIVKSYAQKDYKYVHQLIFSSTKFSFILLFFLSLPILLHTEYVLTLWLKQVPEYTSLFVQLTLIDLFVSCTFSPMASLSQASGKIRNYQLIISIVFLLIFCFTWISYRLGYPVYWAFVLSIIFNLLGLFARIYELKCSQSFPAWRYVRQVFLPILLCFLIILLVAQCIKSFLQLEDSILMLLYCTLLYWVSGACIVWILMLNSNEKNMIQGILRKIFYMLK